MKFQGLSTSKIHFLGASMVCAMYAASPTAQAASNLGYSYGSMNFAGTVELVNNANKVLGTLPSGVTNTGTSAQKLAEVATVPVSVVFNGPAYKVGTVLGSAASNQQSAVQMAQATQSVNTGSFYTNFNVSGIPVTSPAPVSPAKNFLFNVLNQSSTSNILNQVVATIPPLGILTWTAQNNSEVFSFILNNLDSNVTYPGSNGTYKLGQNGADFEVNGEGTLNGYKIVSEIVNGHSVLVHIPFLATAASFNVSIVDSNVKLLNNGGFADAITISSLAAVPLPAAIFFVAPALAGVFGFSRRKNGSNATA